MSSSRGASPVPQADTSKTSAIAKCSTTPARSNTFQMLMGSTVTVECGKPPCATLTIHEDLLRRHSKVFDQLLINAKPLKGQYERTSALRTQLAAYTFPQVTTKAFEVEHMEARAIPLILHAYNNYPILGYRDTIIKAVDMAIEDQVRERNTKVTQTTPAAKKKLLQAIIDLKKVVDRLALLSPRGVHAVVGELFGKLHSISERESSKAKDDPVRAAAQSRLLLPGAEEATVSCVMQWIYQETLHYENVEQLYSLLSLADQLRMAALAEECLGRLCNAVNDSLHNAYATGISLSTLLAYEEGPSDDAVSVVFSHTMRTSNAPRELVSLVVNALAGGMDVSLWCIIRNQLNLEMVKELMDVIVERQYVKTEELPQASVKTEETDMTRSLRSDRA